MVTVTGRDLKYSFIFISPPNKKSKGPPRWTCYVMCFCTGIYVLDMMKCYDWYDPWKSTWNGCPSYRPLTHPKEKATTIISVPSIIPAPPCSTTVDGSEILRSPVEVGRLSPFFGRAPAPSTSWLGGFIPQKTVCTTNTTVGTFTKYIGYSRWWIGSTYSGSTATCCEQSAKCAPMALVKNHAGTDIQSNIQPRGMED